MNVLSNTYLWDPIHLDLHCAYQIPHQYQLHYSLFTKTNVNMIDIDYGQNK